MELRRVGLVFAGDSRDDGVFSGTPSGLARGFRMLGAEIVHVDTRAPGEAAAATSLAAEYARRLPIQLPPASLERLVRMSPELTAIRHAHLRRTLARLAPSCDALVHVKSDSFVEAPTRQVVFDDQTSEQWFAPLGPADAEHAPAQLRAAKRNREKNAWAAADAVCFATHAACESARSYGAGTSLYVVGLGRNIEPVLQRRDWAVPRFLFVGGNWERKNGASDVRAFTQTRQHHPRTELHLVGEHPPPALHGVVGHGRLDLRSWPARARLGAIFGASTCFVMPSLREAAGVVFAEAGAAGLPSIGGTNGGAATMIGPGGILVNPLDHDELTGAMQKLAVPATAAAVGARAYRHAQRLTWHHVAARIANALHATTPRPPPAGAEPL